MLNKSVHQSVCISPYVPSTLFQNKLCLRHFITPFLLPAQLGPQRARSYPTGQGEPSREGDETHIPHQGTCSSLPLPCTATASLQCPAGQETSCRESSAFSALTALIHEIISETNSGLPALGDSASLQQPRHKTKASQGFVITTPHC